MSYPGRLGNPPTGGRGNHLPDFLAPIGAGAYHPVKESEMKQSIRAMVIRLSRWADTCIICSGSGVYNGQQCATCGGSGQV